MKKSRIQLVSCALGVSLALTACQQTVKKPQDNPETPAVKVEASGAKGWSATPAPSSSTKDEAKKLADMGIDAITASLGVEVDITPERAPEIQSGLVENVAAIGLLFDEIKGELEASDREQFEGRLKSLGEALDQQAGLSGEELVAALKENRAKGSKLALTLFDLQEKTTNSVATGSAPDLDFMVEPGRGFGAITKESTVESIKAHYGEENFAMEEREIGLDLRKNIGVLFSGDPRKELWVFFEEGQISQLRIPTDTDGSTTIWQTADGLTIGTPLTKVHELNGTDFRMRGMMQANAGMVTDWRNGRLDGMYMGLMAPISEMDGHESLYEGEISSSDSTLQEVNPKVFSLGIQF